MSLQIWLPLNGNINNYGVMDLQEPGHNAIAFSNGGKLGGQFISNGSFLELTGQQTAKILNNKEFSYCSWIYIGPNATAGRIFGNESISANNNRKFTIYKYPTKNDLHLSWMNDTAIQTFLTTVIDGALPNGWTHLAITYNKPTCKIYINGSLTQTLTGVSNSATFNYDTPILITSTDNGISDLRLYNNCLSAKEVKEISKGLIVHYKLDNPMETSLRNKYTGAYTRGACYDYTREGSTYTMNEDGLSYKYTMNYTGTGSSTWWSLIFPVFSFTPGKKYQWHCKVRTNSCTSNTNLTMRCARISNDWQAPSTALAVSPSYIGKGWITCNGIITLESTSIRAGTEYNTEPRMEFYTPDRPKAGEVYAFDFDIKDVMICETDSIVDFIDNDLCTSTLTDSTGHGYDLKLQGSVKMESNQPCRYGTAVNFNQTGYYYNTAFNYQSNTMSIAFWLKPSTTTTAQHFVFGTFNPLNSNGTGMYRNSASTGYALTIKADAESSYNSVVISLTNGVWHHIVMTYNSTTENIYINGSLYRTYTYGNGGTISNPSIHLGNSNYNSTPSSETSEDSMSDFRIYATALSDADIKELYSVAASIDKNGNVHCYKLIEN